MCRCLDVILYSVRELVIFCKYIFCFEICNSFRMASLSQAVSEFAGFSSVLVVIVGSQFV